MIFEILFWHSDWVGKSYFNIQNPILTFELSRKIVFYFDIQNPILTFELSRKIVFYFEIQNSILTFELRWKMLFWYPKLYFDIRTVSENRNFCHSKSDFDIQTESENAILTFKILFWHLNWVGKCNLIFKFMFWHSIWVEKWYFDILNPNFNIRTESENAILIFKKSYFDIRTESEHRIFSFNILFSHSNWIGKLYFDIQYPILTFELSRKILFWY